MRIDRQHIAQMLGDPELVDQFLALFEVETSEMIKQIRSDNINRSELNRLAHTLKTHFAYTGLEVLSKKALNLELITNAPKNIDAINVVKNDFLKSCLSSLDFLDH